MKKNCKKLIAIVLAILMLGSVIPTMAFAVAEETKEHISDSQNVLQSVINDIKEFFQRVIDFFKWLFGIKDEPVIVPVEAIDIAEESITIEWKSGEEAGATANAAVLPANASNKVIVWTSSNEDVASVDTEGNIVAVSRGKATITATSADDSTKSDSIEVEVRDLDARYVDDVAAFRNAMLTDVPKGGSVTVVLESDLILDAETPLLYGLYMFLANGRNVTIDLNGCNITCVEDASLKTKAIFTTGNGGTFNIIGDGTVEVKNGRSGIFHAMNANDRINVYGGTYISNSDNGNDALAIFYTNSGNIDIYGGTFIPREGTECANAEDKQGNRLSIVFHEGALLSHPKYQKGDSTRIQLAEGCELKEVEIDGETWYKVIKAA